MTFSFRPAALAAALALVPAATQAQDKTGWYASISGMYVLPLDSKVSRTVLEHDVSTTMELGGGFGLTAALGYALSSSLRVEAEFGYRNTGMEKAKGLKISGAEVNENISGTVEADGKISTLSLMVNGIASFDVWRVRPYVGLGLGAARHEAELDRLSATVGETTYSADFEGSEDAWVFAYQAMAGVAYPLAARTEARAGYRYFATSAADFKGTKATYGTHNFEIGLMFRF
ncbi:MAG: porin family protein [Rhodospirillaceae bacterium]|nr:porin family protein [Rhodospirillaceae bacterium]